MYSKGKYLIGELATKYVDQYVAICFPETVGHDDIGKFFNHDTVIAGGFFYVQDGKVVPYGKSISMGVDSRPEDVKFLQRALGMSDE